MSLRLEMLQVTRLAPRALGESAVLVRDFLLGQQHPDGGFRNRDGRSDLYYTVFGLDALIGLQAELPAEKLERYLEAFGDGEQLDFVHLCALARARAALGLLSAPDALLDRLERFRSPDGGYHPQPGSETGTVYGAFLALGAYEDLRREVPGNGRLGESLSALGSADGAWANERGARIGSTNATAAAVLLSRHLSLPIDPAVAAWLLERRHPEGGFLAAPRAPMPDLLSTATALHALSSLEVPTEPLQRQCLDFVDTLWTNEGGFYGHWGDDAVDCEYAFYGLLALGHLS